MIKKNIAAFSLSFLALSVNAEATDFQPQIHNGLKSQLNEVPYQARLIIERTDGNVVQHSLCGASILDSSVLLTAAHCLENVGAMNFTQAYVTYLDFEDPEAPVEKLFSVYPKDVAIHDLWDGNIENKNDIAVIYAKNQLLNAKKIKVAGESGFDNMMTEFDNLYVHNGASTGNLLASGYGLDENDVSNVLNRVILTGVSRTYCEDMKAGGGSSDDIICTKSPDVEVNYAICSGDSGGPLVWKDKGNLADADFGLRLVGVTSYVSITKLDKKCIMKNDNEHGGFTKISHYYDWINQTVDSMSGSSGYDVTSIQNVSYDFDIDPFIGSEDEEEEPEYAGLIDSSKSGGSTSILSFLGLLGLALIRRRK
ncbi:trypsin family protein [Vibrio parahaemolyticus VPCR-2010]|nr:trypsin family protein [Vibrio parahaemolyticus VPCR-2010]